VELEKTMMLDEILCRKKSRALWLKKAIGILNVFITLQRHIKCINILVEWRIKGAFGRVKVILLEAFFIIIKLYTLNLKVGGQGH
jgi:hypothetical protein